MDQIEQVKKLREEHERALDAVESRRAAYHDAVLELYRGGTSLREIAKELGLSHQRVHQMVSAEPPRGRKLPRAAASGAAAALIVVAAILGALRLAHASPFASGASVPVSIPGVVNQPASAAIQTLEDVGLHARVLYVEHKPVFAPDQVLSQKGPAGALVAKGSVVILYVATQRHVAIGPATRFVALHLGRGFIPGGAVLRDGREVLSGVSSFGRVALWVAPGRTSRTSRCSWLEIDHRGSGGTCYQQPDSRGIPAVVPWVHSRRGTARRTISVPLIWGRTNTNVARLTLVFQDGKHVRVPFKAGMFLYAVRGSHSRFTQGHRPAFLVARDTRGREIDRRPVRLDRAASY